MRSRLTNQSPEINLTAWYQNQDPTSFSFLSGGVRDVFREISTARLARENAESALNHGLIATTPPSPADAAGSPGELGTDLRGSTGHDAGSKLQLAWMIHSLVNNLAFVGCSGA